MYIIASLNYIKGLLLLHGCKILSFDKENEKISLGMKQLTDNPWDQLDESLQANSSIKGKIISIKDYKKHGNGHLYFNSR